MNRPSLCRLDGVQIFAAILAAILVLGALRTARADQPTFSAAAEQWGVQEITLRSTQPHKNPFADVKLQAQFRSGTKNVLVDGFYDGDQTWKIRLMPEAQGRWSFRTISNDKLLDAKKGSFLVGPPGAGNHGPVKVAKTYHYSHADGTPYFALGTTLYNWLNRDPALEERTLASLAKSPFNKIRFGIFPKWIFYNRVDPPAYPYEQTANKQFDLDRFNPKFFEHVENRLRDLQKLGIEADIILFHPYDNWGFARMDAAHDDAYIRYVAARLSAFRNVWWTLCNEFNLFHESLPNLGLKAKDWDRMFQVLQSADPYSHLRGMHNAGPWYDHAKPWITHVVAQEPKRLTRLTLRGRETYRKPVLIEEYVYEGNTGQIWGDLTGREVMNRHWEITMAGGYASHGETYVHPGGLLWWAVGGELVGDSPARLGFLKDVMTTAPFQDLKPSPELVMGGTALAKKGEYYLFQFAAPPTEPAQIKTEGAASFKVDLIDPWQMKVYPLGYTPAGTQAFSLLVFPSLLRFTRVEQMDSALPSGSLTELLTRFVDDRTQPAAPAVRPFKAVTEYYSVDWPLNELLADPRTRALIEKHAPAWLKLPTEVPLTGGLPIDYLRHFSMVGPSERTTAQFNVLAAELSQIPVKADIPCTD